MTGHILPLGEYQSTIDQEPIQVFKLLTWEVDTFAVMSYSLFELDN